MLSGSDKWRREGKDGTVCQTQRRGTQGIEMRQIAHRIRVDAARIGHRIVANSRRTQGNRASPQGHRKLRDGCVDAARVAIEDFVRVDVIRAQARIHREAGITQGDRSLHGAGGVHGVLNVGAQRAANRAGKRA